METRNDFSELLTLFNAHHVEYMIVGGYALAFHGAPRFTGDIDLFIRPTPENAARILAALDDFGFGSLNLTANDFTTSGNVIQLGVAPVRIDIITSVTGVSWETANASKVCGSYGNVPVFYIGREDFVRNKRAIGRHKDLADVDSLSKEEEMRDL